MVNGSVNNQAWPDLLNQKDLLAVFSFASILAVEKLSMELCLLMFEKAQLYITIMHLKECLTENLLINALRPESGIYLGDIHSCIGRKIENFSFMQVERI